MGFEIQLGNKKNVNAINVDQNINIELFSSNKEIFNFNESSVLNVNDIFNAERQESESYRVYGRIDFISIINGLHKDYKLLTDFFTPPRLGDEFSGITKNLPFCFDVYLCYPSSGNTIISPETFIRNYTIVSKINNIHIYKAGYSDNIFFDNIFLFDFNIDFSVEGTLDSFGKPINFFYLYFNFKPSVNGFSIPETVNRKNYGGSPIPFPYTGTHNIGDVVIGDLVNYVNSNFEETLVDSMEYYVRFPYNIGTLQFKYNPFIPIKIRDFGDEIISANISGGTEIDLNIPSYAINIDNHGTYIWKDILQNGFIDPITNKGVDFPFVNKRHYVFNTIILGLKPDINDLNTFNVFNDIKFNTNTGLFTKPSNSSNLNNLGNKCV